MQRVKKEIRKMLDHLMGLDLNDKYLMKAINCRIILAASYVTNVCNLRESDLNKLQSVTKYLRLTLDFM